MILRKYEITLYTLLYDPIWSSYHYTSSYSLYIPLSVIYPISKHNGYPAMLRYSVDPNLTLLYDSIWFSYHHNSSYRLLKCQFILSDLYKFEITIHILLYDPIWSSYHYTRSYSLYIPLSVIYPISKHNGYPAMLRYSVDPNLTLLYDSIWFSYHHNSSYRLLKCQLHIKWFV